MLVCLPCFCPDHYPYSFLLSAHFKVLIAPCSVSSAWFGDHLTTYSVSSRVLDISDHLLTVHCQLQL